MIAKASKLNSRAFLMLLRKSKRIDSANFYFRFEVPGGAGNFCFAVVVPKKVLAGAVARNKLKRQIFNIIDRMLKSEQASCSGIFFTKKGVDKLKFRQIVDQIGYLFSLAKNPRTC